MLYRIELPEITLERLTDVVYLQMTLLRYASYRSPSQLNKEDCAVYFEKSQRFRGRHKEIAEWIFRGSTKRKLLETFASGNQSEKLAWSRNLHQDVVKLLYHPCGLLNPYIKDQNPTEWKQAGVTFLINFYEEYLDSLPKNFFSESQINNITKGSIRESFEQINKTLEVCPTCDFEIIRDEIDHYLPKSVYPHLSCHPFNLMPICGACNDKQIKGNIDLLRKGIKIPRQLEQILLPYRTDGLAKHIYLDFDLSENFRQPINIQYYSQTTSSYDSNYLKIHANTYKLSSRWIKMSSNMESSLFRTIKKIIKNPDNKPYLNIFDIQEILDQYLSEELIDEQGKTGFAFPMTWWLATLINQQIEPVINSEEEIDIQDYPFLAEIATWIEQETIQHPQFMNNETLKKARELRKKAQ
ncbi:conserved hypothetical protein [Rippkaea orientalis PCC 8801]|uniref:HNH nuclease domain-containing protein n=1 Tax=Rippkaea orientalis (strain PCC 8801 / RF-1) TaxID=41431 RepID=B7JWC8_RIPO1|nr:hypothetical protein [Rippkaea orientalis]ACK66973.1 conserved hypothetical protein [Rippkaea orientalis PCC 8801]